MPRIKDITKYQFNKKNVHFIWDSSLTEKKVLCANNIDALILQVNSMVEPQCITQSNNHSKPFKYNGRFYRFAYYDPRYIYEYETCLKKLSERAVKPSIVFTTNNLYYDWNDNLEGKTIIYDSFVSNIIRNIENGSYRKYTGKATNSKDNELPFCVNGKKYPVVYYDPLLNE